MTNRRLTQDEFIALRSLEKERWGGQHGLRMFWKFNRTWRRAYEHETEAAWDAVTELEGMGLVEEGYCCPKQCRFYLQLTPRGREFLKHANGIKQPAQDVGAIRQVERRASLGVAMKRLQAFSRLAFRRLGTSTRIG